jgi:hypothetical protein
VQVVISAWAVVEASMANAANPKGASVLAKHLTIAFVIFLPFILDWAVYQGL